ncbi:gas vesicle protein GvpG [Labedaea rhizosphaerae]|uniref:Gas vesicle protein GvpG n=1 Tax=Labedaea rhizosphaerae TaxID=598644 RepID=A0A4R6S472_LABRH|nr:gas vesicle protein GvpG [Labedaea rhizosphaerae]TDP94093.1 gas vesicle protein GvpG [Labedaea rhizosphaerae]
MGLVSGILGLPLAPIRGVLALGELIRQRVEEEQRNPAAVRRELEAAQAAREAGEITPEEEAEVQQRALNRVTRSPTKGRGD